jgi:hypothetical protein
MIEFPSGAKHSGWQVYAQCNYGCLTLAIHLSQLYVESNLPNWSTIPKK